MTTYLTQTKYKTFKYQRRVPKALINYIGTNTFRVSLGADTTEATVKALHFNSLIDEALKLIALSVADDIIISKLSPLVPKPTKEKLSEPHKDGLYLDVVSNFLESKKGNVSHTDYEGSIYFYTVLCPSLFKQIFKTDSPKLSSITYKDLLKFRTILLQLPKQNIQKYKSMEMNTILKNLDSVPQHERISANTVNKYIQRLRGLFEFSLNLGLITNNLAKSIKLVEVSDDKLQRLPLSPTEYNSLLELLPTEKRYLTQVLYCTGMRLSELYKCNVELIENTLCFSLLDRNIKLKTKSSYRVIPVHSKLINDIEMFTTYRDSITPDNLAKSISKLIKKHKFKDANKKSLYSLRHSFASELIYKGADNVLVSQLMGHSLMKSGGMTLSRYASGYSTEQLKEVVELLD